MPYRFFFLFLLGIHHWLAAQSADSLYRAYQQEPVLEKRIALLERIIAIQTHQDLNSTLRLIDTLAAYYQSIKDEKNYHKVQYQYKGFLYSVHESYAEAIKYYQQYAKVAELNDEGGGYFLIDLGNMYYTLQLFNMARKYYEDAEVLFKKLNNYRGLATTYGNYSLVAKKLQQPDSAFFYIHKALEIQQEFVKDTFQIAHIYHVMGRLHSENKQEYRASIPEYQKAIALLTLPQLKQSTYYQQFIHVLPQSYMRLGKAYCNLNQQDSCLACLQTALDVAKETRQERSILETTLALAEEQARLARYELALPLLLQAEQLATAVNNQTSLLECYKDLKNSYLQTKQAAMATFYWTKYDSLQAILQVDKDKFLVMNDQVLQQERVNTIAEQSKIIEMEARNLKIVLFFLGLIAIAFLVSFVFAWMIRRKNTLIASYAQQLKAANATKDVLLMTIGHDLRSPFGGIINSTLSLTNQLKNKELEQLEQTSQQLVTASKSAYMMMDGLMQWAVLQKEEKVAQPRAFRLMMLIADIVSQLQPIVQMSNIQIELKIADCTLLSDPNMLNIMVRNLLTNAIKYSPPQSQILVETALENGQLQLNMYNRGGQISDATLAAINASHNYYEIAKKGSGLGLQLVKEFAQQLHIQFQLQNQPNQQVLSRLTFPPNALLEMAESPTISTFATANASNTSIPKQAIEMWAAQLRQHDIYESTAIKAILEQIPNNAAAAVQDWKQQVSQAVYQMNEPLFLELIAI